MPRRPFPREAFHMDHLRSSPSQQHLDPTSRSSSSSHQDHTELDQEMGQTAAGSPAAAAGLLGSALGMGEYGMGQRSHKLDLYSVPVFLLESLLLAALAYSAYFVHFQYKLAPLLSGFYCDDISLRQEFTESKLTRQFFELDSEITVIVLLLVVPLVAMIFCELVNSMFGAIKFRQVRSLCKCCKLHSITRRTLRFSAAYLLGFFIIMISCDILATSAGKLRPYFAQECPLIYKECFVDSNQPLPSTAPIRDGGSEPSDNSTRATFDTPPVTIDPSQMPVPPIRPLSRPISDNLTQDTVIDKLREIVPAGNPLAHDRTRRDTNPVATAHANKNIVERKWIELTNSNLAELCQFSGESDRVRKFDSIAKSWPSFPGAIFTYACLYLACYLSFVGTARPFRFITSILVSSLVMLAIIFNVQLVKEHYNHWEDVSGGALLSLTVVLLVILVYLNKFRDTHYYESQKLYGPTGKRLQQLRRSILLDGTTSPYTIGYTNEAGQYQLDKIDAAATAPVVHSIQQNGTDPNANSTSNNDLAMRYFQIPRANYRAAPRPLSAMNRA